MIRFTTWFDLLRLVLFCFVLPYLNYLSTLFKIPKFVNPYLQWCFFLKKVFLGKCHVNIKDPSVSDCEFHLLLKRKMNYKVTLDLKWNKTWSYLCSGNIMPEHKYSRIFSIKNAFVIFAPKILSYEWPWKIFKELSLLVLLKNH